MKPSLFRNLLAGALVAAGLGATPAQAQEGPSIVDLVEAWLASPHAQRDDPAFTHWDEDGEVAVACATCHSGPGFIDFLGGDDTAAGIVDHPAPTGAPVDCAACHNAAAAALDTVTFPSGVEVSGLGSSAICAVCHQGRQSTDSVNAAIAGGEDDTVNGDLGFLNVHYRAAAATLLGGAARGGYQYDGKVYVGQFSHVPDLNTCASCHEPHTTEVALDQCTTCHKGVEEFRAIRINPADFDGDGDTTEGVHGEIMTLHAALGVAIQSYAAEVAGQPIVYDSHAYPYFFNDGDGDGAVTEGEAIYPNRYASWTPRLLKAAYNYQFVAKDPGGYTHNPKYLLQILHDSLESLGESVEVDMAGILRP
jgi:hypothetical protein